MRYTLDTRITRCCLPSVCFNHLRRSGNVQLLFPRRSILTLITDYSGHRPRSRWLPIESRGDQMLDSSAWDCDLFSVFATTLIKFFIYGHVCHGKNWCDYLWLITWPMPHCLLGSARPPRSDCLISPQNYLITSLIFHLISLSTTQPDFYPKLSYHMESTVSHAISSAPHPSQWPWQFSTLNQSSNALNLLWPLTTPKKKNTEVDKVCFLFLLQWAVRGKYSSLSMRAFYCLQNML